MRKVLLLIISFLVAGFIQAQTAKVLADKIVGILGDKIVLKSDLLNYIDDIQRRGGEVPADAQCVLLQRMLMDKALVLQAEKDSLPVSEEEIQAELDQRIRYFIMEFGGKEAVEQVAGRTIFQMKEDFRPSVKERRLADAMRSKIVESIKITPQEVKAYFDKIPKDSLRFYETELTVGQIILFPKAGRELEKYVIDELNDYKRQIESGRSFESFARLYTEDPGSKQNGGRYEINKNEKTWDPDFKNAAFRLREGQVSPVIKSKFGYHIIQMVSRNGDDAVIRHILRIPEVTQVEVEAAKVKLDSIRSKLIAGTLSFGEAVDKYSEDEGSKFTAGLVSGQNGTNVTIDELDKDMVKDLDKLKVGEYSAPIAFQDQQGSKKGVRIVVIQSKSEPHRENLRDDYNKIAIRAIEEKREQAVEKWFQTRLPSYFVMVDPEFQNCESIRKTFPDIAKKAN
ncbi:MAG: peptidylprolyl isomerase [Sphingobacteriales bacterium]|jgi:peptidyl-prolyl cis-trans isomerase SurA